MNILLLSDPVGIYLVLLYGYRGKVVDCGGIFSLALVADSINLEGLPTLRRCVGSPSGKDTATIISSLGLVKTGNASAQRTRNAFEHTFRHILHLLYGSRQEEHSGEMMRQNLVRVKVRACL